MKQMNLRLPDELHARLKAEAEVQERALHAEILYRLKRSMERSAPQHPAEEDGEVS